MEQNKLNSIKIKRKRKLNQEKKETSRGNKKIKDKNEISKDENELQINKNELLNPEQKLPFTDYIEKIITGDGNCFYRAIFYNYKEEDDHLEFRNLLYDWTKEHKEEYIEMIPEEKDN